MHNRQLSKKSNLNCIFGHFLTSKNHFFPFLQWMKNDNNNTVCKKRSHGGINLNVKILVQIIISMYRAGQECLQPPVKHSEGSVLVWRWISASAVGNVLKINGIRNSAKYSQILIHNENIIWSSSTSSSTRNSFFVVT